MTNADIIRKMTDEQLFEFLSEWEVGDIDYSITFCNLCMQSKAEGGRGNELGLDCDGCRKHWLQRDAVDFGGLMYWKRNTTFEADTPQTELKGSKRLVKGSEEETEAERLDRIDNEIEDAWARIKELTPQTEEEFEEPNYYAPALWE